ncbi:hypothetical protein [Sphingobium subterraneum]|uniref:Uncharacterized protein n=1 Tax=Sphingobium subterraneum TaxID=627688 RepID=A0A841IUK9_9SPHN|nr:hypothetical protein [Sphingobium subterraneum]MBB6122363.1 hypothetical protein [Sphingobium subterraneum]
MSTETVTGASSAATRQQRERQFYFRMALLIVAVVFIGFAPSFYLKPLDIVHYPRPEPDLNGLLLVHGSVFSLWLAVFFAQTALVSAGRRDLHRILGVFGFALAVVMIPIMYVTTLDEIARNSTPPFADVLTWSAVPLTPIPFYAYILWRGWTARKGDLASHKRIMLGLMIMLTQPATGRLPVLPPTLWGFAGLGLLSLLLFVPLARWDKSTLGHVHPATKLGAGVMVAILVVQTACMAMPDLWKPFVMLLPGIAA